MTICRRMTAKRMVVGVVGTMMLCAPALAGEAVMRFDAPTKAGKARVFITDLSGDTVDVQVNIPAGMTATQKRNAIRTAVQNAITAGGLPWGVADEGPNGMKIINPGNLSLVANFFPRDTGELRDYITVPGNQGSFRGGHGRIDPHSPLSLYNLWESDGVPTQFTAGVIVEGTEYSVTLLGYEIDPSASYATGGQITSALFSALTALGIPHVALSLGPSGIDVYFPPGVGEAGIVWGTNALTDDELAFYGSLTAVPEPQTLLAVFAAPAVSLMRARRRHG